MFKIVTHLFLTGIILLLAVPTTVSLQAVRVEGIDFQRSVTVRDNHLTLQGYGLLRYMLFIKAYVGALYLPQAAGAADVLGPVAKRLELQYFHAIKGEDFARATRTKIADNTTPVQAEQLRSRIEQLVALYEDVQPGDRYTLTYVPGRGTELALNDRSLGTVRGSDFARALFAVWLGDNPIDTDFRDVLLGVR